VVVPDLDLLRFLLLVAEAEAVILLTGLAVVVERVV
jgi:hypothetical protein